MKKARFCSPCTTHAAATTTPTTKCHRVVGGGTKENEGEGRGGGQWPTKGPAKRHSTGWKPKGVPRGGPGLAATGTGKSGAPQ